MDVYKNGNRKPHQSNYIRENLVECRIGAFEKTSAELK